MRRALATVVLLAALAAAPSAHADGDPASDVLLLQDVYSPYQPPVPKTVLDALNNTVKQLHKAGFPLKVAILASKTDMGTVPQFLGRPQPYATFLESEIKFNKAKPLLVVMEAGYGTAEIDTKLASAVQDLPKPSSGSPDALGRAAIDGVLKIAAADGHPIAKPTLPAAKDSGGGGGTSPAIIFGIPVLLLAIGGALATWRARQTERAAS
jgi:hypothetical protein